MGMRELIQLSIGQSVLLHLHSGSVHHVGLDSLTQDGVVCIKKEALQSVLEGKITYDDMKKDTSNYTTYLLDDINYITGHVHGSS